MQTFVYKRQATNILMAYKQNLTIIVFLAVFVSGALSTDLFQVKSSLPSRNVLAIDNFSIQNYTQILRGRSLSLEFFDFIKNSSENDLSVFSSERAIGLQNLKCLTELGALSTGISQGKLWAFKFIDAWGSIPAGMLIGRFMDLGNYDECIRIDQNITKNLQMQGKYCIADLPILQLLGVQSSIVFNMGTCVPASCQAAELNAIFTKFFKKVLNVDLGTGLALLSDKNCKVKPNKPLSTVAIIFIVLLSVLGALVVLSTLCDYFTHKAPLHPVVKAFSARVNARQLFRISDNTNNPNVISCLNGIRCMSLIWVIFAHCFLALLNQTTLNALDVYSWIETPFAMFITQAFFSVDSFFFLSGLLLVMVVMREMDKTSGKLNVPLMYLHRYLRLTPILIFGMLFTLSVEFMSDGPVWESMGPVGQAVCEEKWWTNLLYVQNYVNPKKMCLAQSWYLAVDMQLYIISPIILISLWKWGKKALAGTTVLLILMWACLFSMIMINGYTMFYKSAGINDGLLHIYFPTHVRTSPWLIGIIFGYYLHKTKGQQIKLSKVVVTLGWIVSLGLIFTCIFSLLPKAQANASPYTTLEEALFVSLTRIAWPLALCWLVFACIHGYGGPIDGFLSAPLWQPFARLSYCVYIFHEAITCIEFGRTRTNMFFSSADLMIRFWPVLGFTLLLSVFMYLLVEAPFSGLEQMLFSKKPTDKKLFQEEVATTEAKVQNSNIVNSQE